MIELLNSVVRYPIKKSSGNFFGVFNRHEFTIKVNYADIKLSTGSIFI